MRSPNRLFNFYNELTRVHMLYYPDWRFGQFMVNFFYWIEESKERDPFYIEEDKMIEYLREYAGELN